MTDPTAPPVKRRGRPRDGTRDAAILSAAAGLLGETGYDRLTIEAVAARAGVAKTTVYRRWGDKPSLIAAVVERRAASAEPRVETRDVRTALLAVMSLLATQMATQDLGVLSAVLAGRRSDPALALKLQSVLRHDHQNLSGPVRSAASCSGEVLVPDVDRVLGDVVPALLLHDVLLTGSAPSSDRLDHYVDRLILPLVLQPEGCTGTAHGGPARGEPPA